MKTNKKVKNQKVNQKKLRKGLVNYPVGDFLVQIKNAAMAKNREVAIRPTNLIKSVADTLKNEKLLDEVNEKDGKLNVRLSYHRKEPLLIDLKLVSKPGVRIYMSADDLENKKGSSFYILSTPKGVMTSYDAIKKRLGGEVIVEIW